MSTLLSGIDWGVVLLYMAGMVVIGFIASKRVSGYEDHILSGRNVPTYYLAPCLITTQIGAGSIVGYVALSYEIGFSGGWWIIGNVATFIVLGLVGAKPLRRAIKAKTLPEWYELRYDSKCRMFTAITTVFVQISYTAGQIIAGAALMRLVFGWEMVTSVIIFSIVVGVYTVFGGLWAVFLTDFVQMFVMVFGMTATIIFGLKRSGGITGVQEIVPPEFFDLLREGEMGTIIASILYSIPAIFCSFDIIQKVMAAKTPKVARTSCFWAAGLAMIFVIAIPAIGILSRVVLGTEVDNTDALFANLIAEVLPIGLQGLAIAAILATLMSSTDACLMAGASVLTNDIVPKFTKFDSWDEKKKKHTSYLITALLMIFCVIAALAIPSALTAGEIGWTLLSCGAFIPMLFGIIWKKTSSKAAFASMIIGAIVGFGWTLIGQPFGLRPVIPAYIVSILTIVICSNIWPQELSEEDAINSGLVAGEDE